MASIGGTLIDKRMKSFRVLVFVRAMMDRPAFDDVRSIFERASGRMAFLPHLVRVEATGIHHTEADRKSILAVYRFATTIEGARSVNEAQRFALEGMQQKIPTIQIPERLG